MEPEPQAAAEDSGASEDGAAETTAVSGAEDAGRRRALGLEILVVVLLFPVATIAYGIWYAVEPFPITFAAEVARFVWETALVCLVLYLAWRDDGSLRSVGLRSTVWWKEILFAVLILGVTAVAEIAITDLTNALGMQVWESDSWGVTRLQKSTGMALFLPFGLLVSALLEEVVYRGFLWTRLCAWTGRPGEALVICATLFALMHARSPAATISLLCYGLIMGAWFWHSRSLPRLVLAHWSLNMLIIYP